jgi:osmotically inducible lipoprotein OsmB
MNKTLLPAALAALLMLAGCSGMTETQQTTLSGGAIGAAGGAVLGAIGGNAGLGAVAGGAAGLLGGYLYGQHRQSVRNAYQQGRTDQRQSDQQ